MRTSQGATMRSSFRSGPFRSPLSVHSDKVRVPYRASWQQETSRFLLPMIARAARSLDTWLG